MIHKLPAAIDKLLICTDLDNGDVRISFRRREAPDGDVEGIGEDIDRALLNLRERLADHIIAINDAIDMRKGH